MVELSQARRSLSLFGVLLAMVFATWTLTARLAHAEAANCTTQERPQNYIRKLHATAQCASGIGTYQVEVTCRHQEYPYATEVFGPQVEVGDPRGSTANCDEDLRNPRVIKNGSSPCGQPVRCQ